MPTPSRCDTFVFHDSDLAVLDLLDVALRASMAALEHLHPELVDEPPRPVDAFSSNEDRLAHLVVVSAHALVTTLRTYRAALDESLDF